MSDVDNKTSNKLLKRREEVHKGNQKNPSYTKHQVYAEQSKKLGAHAKVVA